MRAELVLALVSGTYIGNIQSNIWTPWTQFVFPMNLKTHNGTGMGCHVNQLIESKWPDLLQSRLKIVATTCFLAGSSSSNLDGLFLLVRNALEGESRFPFPFCFWLILLNTTSNRMLSACSRLKWKLIQWQICPVSFSQPVNFFETVQTNNNGVRIKP